MKIFSERLYLFIMKTKNNSYGGLFNLLSFTILLVLLSSGVKAQNMSFTINVGQREYVNKADYVYLEPQTNAVNDMDQNVFNNFFQDTDYESESSNQKIFRVSDKNVIVFEKIFKKYLIASLLVMILL